MHISYSKINIVKCQAFIDGSVTTADAFGIMVSSMNEERLIRKAGIKVITNDINNPSVKFNFIDKSKGTTIGINQYTTGVISEWAILINRISNNSSRIVI